jgi:hypothetical protein
MEGGKIISRKDPAGGDRDGLNVVIYGATNNFRFRSFDV